VSCASCGGRCTKRASGVVTGSASHRLRRGAYGVRVQEMLRLRAKTSRPVGSMGGFNGGNELLAVLGLGQWARHLGVAEGRVEKLIEKFCGDGSSVMGLRVAD
jgi:hypothetical protein